MLTAKPSVCSIGETTARPSPGLPADMHQNSIWVLANYCHAGAQSPANQAGSRRSNGVAKW